MSEFGRLMTAGNQFRYRGRFVPGPVLVALCHYAVDGRDPGDFLRAALANDLNEAVFLCDNYDSLGAICAFIYNELPSQLHGDREKIVTWLSQNQARNRGLLPSPRLVVGPLTSGQDDGLTTGGNMLVEEDHEMEPPSTPLGRLVSEQVMEEDEERRERADHWLKEPY